MIISWTKGNPPTGTGDAGFTLNNEFNALSSVSVLCGTDFIRYKPYEDDPEEIEPDEGEFSWGALVGHCLAGLTVVGIVAGGLAYGASLVFTGGATAVLAPWIVGGLAGLCGTAAVGNMAANDYKRGEVSSFDDYVWVGGSKALEGALAGAAFCMVPYAAEVVAATVVPYGMAGICLPAGAFISGETIATVAMSVGYTVTCSNMLVKVNDSVATVSGNNAMAYLIGEKNYQAIKDTSEAASNTVFMLGLSNPRLYGTNNNAGNVKENASYQNGKTNLGNEVWESKGGASTANPYDLQPTHSQTLSNKKMNILIDDIKVNGIQEAIKYVEYNGQMYVVDGHHRLLAAKRLGLTEVLIEEVEIPYAGYSTIDDLLWFD